ncbi:hypothetical protein [Micromonospora sp. WMMB235]|uniref:hypothetical protein n=1 Tax=Micromonospora sp. WMMB235 TaxID=1172030 RepID=UPI0008D9591E|nr:hypothetical protein [Micromonospora sp. WMMB235]OHX04628.1 hypothetical protein BFV98_17370 [Micromonospora sp. WMMB235]
MTYEIYDPFKDRPDKVDSDRWLEQEGWSEFFGIGGEESDLRIRSYRRIVKGGREEYIVDVWDLMHGSPFVKVDNIGELMDLLARWAPAVQAAALVYVLDELQSYRLDRRGVVEAVTAKAAWGATEGAQALVADEREQAARRRQVAAQRKAAPGAVTQEPR